MRGKLPLEAIALVTDAGIHAYPAVVPQLAAHELLARAELGDTLKRLEARYRWVIVDSPPLLLVPDTQLVAPHVGACLGVVRAGTTSRASLRELGERLPHDRTIGVFLNEARPPLHTRKYQDSGYYGPGQAEWESP